MKNGIDVSAWQGNIDWAKVKASGVEFAILRAGIGREASQIDKYFEKNYREARAQGIPVGVYWYSYANSVDRVLQEAKACLTVLANRELDLPVFYDIEYEPAILALSTQVRTAMVIGFTNAIQAAGYQAGVYASLDFIKNKLTDSQIPEQVVRWIAQYGPSQCTYKGNLYAWQKSSKGRIAGISGNVDLDELYADVQAHEVVKKTNEELAQEVLEGKWGNGAERKAALTAAGYNYSAVQKIVNDLCKAQKTTKSNEELAEEVIAGKWGNGAARKKALEQAGYDYTAVQRLVDHMLR